MWEVFSEGKMPFENRSNLQVVEAISKGFRLYRPYLAPMSIYEVMYSCWHEVSALTFLQRLAVPASESRLIITHVTPGLCHGRKRFLFLGNDPWEPEVLPQQKSLTHFNSGLSTEEFSTFSKSYLSKIGSYRNSMLLKPPWWKVLLLLRTSGWKLRVESDLFNFHVEREGWCFYLLHSTIIRLAFPRVRVMGFISPVAFETPDRLNKNRNEGRKCARNLYSENSLSGGQFLFYLKCQP